MSRIINTRNLLAAVLVITAPSALASVSLGEASENLMAPTKVLTYMVQLACYIGGVVLIFSALAQYKLHRQSPKLVPLTTPVLLMLFGIVLVVTPYFSSNLGTNWSATKADEGAAPGRQAPRIRTSPIVPGPGEAMGADLRQPGNTGEGVPNDPTFLAPEEESTGHWTDDPQYR